MPIFIEDRAVKVGGVVLPGQVIFQKVTAKSTNKTAQYAVTASLLYGD